MDTGPGRFFEFDSFRVDVVERELLRDGEPIALTPKVFDMLQVLLEHRGRTVEKGQLIREVWGNVYVEDGSLNRNISTLRRALGDDPAEQRYIKTLPKRGYRFTAEVREVVEETTVSAENGFKKKGGRDYATTRPLKLKFRANRNGIVFIVVLIFTLTLAAVLALTMWHDRRSEVDVSELTPNERHQLEKHGSLNLQAYDDYVKGRSLWHQRSAEGLHQSIIHLERSVASDPNFALAHAALADAYAFDTGKRNLAKGEAEEAIRLDPTLGEPYASIGFVQMFWEWKLADAGISFERAVDLSPNYATAHQWYAINLVTNRWGGSALAEMKHAYELEPRSLAISADLCQIYYFLRKYDDAVAQCLKTIEADPGFFNAHLYLYDIYTAKGMYDEAVAEFFKIEQLKSDFVLPVAETAKLRDGFAREGIRGFWKARVAYLERNPDSYKLAQYYARLGENDRALAWLEKSFATRDFDFVFFATDPVFQNLSKEPKFAELVKSLNSQ